MSKFICRLAVFFAIQAILVAWVLRYGGPGAGDHFMCSVFDKMERMKTTNGPRIIFVGGSNVAFGIDSKRIGDAVGREPVNFGIHAGLGLDFHLTMVQQRAREGDLIIVMPEYQTLVTEKLYGDFETYSILREVWPEAKKYFQFERQSWKHYLDHDAFWASHVWWRRARHRYFDRKVNPFVGVYRRRSFNEYGDVVAHLTLPSPDVKIGGTNVKKIEPQYVQQSIDRLNAFHDACAERGARVLLSFPPIPKYSYQENKENIEWLHGRLAAELKFPIIDRPEQFSYPRNYFFDTPYHLTATGRQKRSSTVISAIKQWKSARRASTEETMTR